MEKGKISAPKGDADEHSGRSVTAPNIRGKIENQNEVPPNQSKDPNAGGVTPKFSEVLKVCILENDGKEGDKQGKVIATLPMKGLGKDFSLKDIRAKLGTKITAEQSFCYEDGSPAEEEEALDDYLKHVNESNPDALEKPRTQNEGGEPKQDLPQLPVPRKLYIAALIEKPKVTELTSSVLNETAFQVKVLEWECRAGEDASAGVLTSRGTLLSKQLDKLPAPPDLTLADLRKKLARFSSISLRSTIHKFCTPTGMTVSDETTTFSEYLRLEGTEVTEKKGLPSVDVVYKLASFLNQPKVDMSTMPGAYEAGMSRPASDDGLFAGEKTASAPELGKERKGLIDEKELAAASGAGEADAASFLTEAQWKSVLQNCGVMHGWVVDRQKNRIVQAPLAAFQLKTKTSTGLKSLAVAPDPDVTSTDKDSTSQGDEKNTEEGSKTVPQDDGEKDDTVVSTSVALTQSTKENSPSKNEAIPSIPRFRVNDNSRIEVTVSSHEFETSMAKNDFCSQSTEASLSGGYAGFSASVSAGYSNSKSDTNKATMNVYKKTMIASYLFPRADIIIHPEDLEPTPELKAALSRFAKDKNIKELRKLYQDFGQVFCKQVTVGGRLQSTKIMEDQTTTTEQEQKEQFKVAVGVQVSTPFGVGAGVKHENEKGSSKSNSSSDEKRKETNVFEAVGGDTILASDPLAWVPTVAKFWNWRVISREGLTPLVDTLSSIAGYTGVKKYFVQAVPVLSKYIELSEGAEVKSRLRLVSEQKCLSKSYLDQSKGVARFDDPVYYLGHTPGTAVEPILQNIKYPSQLSNVPMFTPAKFRAPVILGYDSDKVSSHTALYGQEFLNTVWSITAPFSDALHHQCRVRLTTVPLETSIEAPSAVNFDPPPILDPKQSGTQAPEAKSKPIAISSPPKRVAVAVHPPSSLVVFRNQQGVFLPGMSSSDESQYWRILKVGAKSMRENIKEGDTIRLCWVFADQTTGFRDFVDDIFGRRRNHCPPELASKVLYPKLPWPCFEDITKESRDAAGSNSMVMGLQPDPEDYWTELLHGKGSSMFMLQDVSFRIDPVANDGRGDTSDYLLPDPSDTSNPTQLLRNRLTMADLARMKVRSQQEQMEKILFLDGKQH